MVEFYTKLIWKYPNYREKTIELNLNYEVNVL